MYKCFSIFLSEQRSQVVFKSDDGKRTVVFSSTDPSELLGYIVGANYNLGLGSALDTGA